VPVLEKIKVAGGEIERCCGKWMLRRKPVRDHQDLAVDGFGEPLDHGLLLS
jgi:hypothetical protein